MLNNDFLDAGEISGVFGVKGLVKVFSFTGYREDILQYNVVTNMSLGKLLPKKWNMNVPFNYAVGEEIITPKYDPYYQDIELQQLIDYTADEAQKRNIRNRAMDYTKRKSINFIGVKKDRGEKQKPHFYDVENVTVS